MPAHISIGFDHHLVKPLDFTEVEAIIRAMTSQPGGPSRSKERYRTEVNRRSFSNSELLL